MYADWKSQVAYSSPNWNGFSFTGGVTQAWNVGGSKQRGGASPAFEGKASYEWAGDFGGKAWVSGITQKVKGFGDNMQSFDVGATVNLAGFGLTGYYYDGSGIGQTVQGNQGFTALGKSRDSNGGYVQATYTIPTVGTKIGLSWGESMTDTDGTAADNAGFANLKDEMWTIGAYHPITKHLNLVAEYSDVKSKSSGSTTVANNASGKAKSISLGAILFF